MIPHEKLRADHRHSLAGQMHGRSTDSIYATLMWETPTLAQLTDLAWEERTRPEWMGGDRSEVYRILEAHKPR